MLLLVDIDGTLLRVDRNVTRAVWAAAWSEVIGGSLPWQNLDSAAGKTDLQILGQLLCDDKRACAVASEFFDALAHHAERSIEPDAVNLCPYAEEFLHDMQQLGATLVVMTGNERRCGWHKLRVAGLDDYFVNGFFGCHAVDRTELPVHALEWARSRSLLTPSARVVVVGDTPNDIRCAKAHGLWSFAVATGPYPMEELQLHQPTACFRHLREVAVSLHRVAFQTAMNRPLIIAIDGPAGSGKTTTARLLAERLGYIYIDTGAMYRALTLAALEEGVPLTDEDLSALLQRITIHLEHTPTGQRTYLNGRDVSERIRDADVTANVSQVSSFPSVRRAMVQLQQQLGSNGGVVMDGRDIGTAVFPNADIKIFMTAELDARAKRRFEELRRLNPMLTEEQIKQQLTERDHFDSSREHNPLRKADDALVVDTTNLTVEEQVERILEVIRQRTVMSNSLTHEQ
jgi:cytidylate kinase